MKRVSRSFYLSWLWNRNRYLAFYNEFIKKRKVFPGFSFLYKNIEMWYLICIWIWFLYNENIVFCFLLFLYILAKVSFILMTKITVNWNTHIVHYGHILKDYGSSNRCLFDMVELNHKGMTSTCNRMDHYIPFSCSVNTMEWNKSFKHIFSCTIKLNKNQIDK